jgi:signal transduction histidine kinase
MIYLLLIAIILLTIVIFYLVFKTNSKSKTIPNEDVKKLTFANSECNKQLLECKKSIEEYKDRILNLQENLKLLKSKSDELTTINQSLEEEIKHLNDKQKRIEDIQKQKDEFFAMYVHDLKNPTSTIQNLTELLNTYDLSFNEQKEIIETLNALSKRIINLTNEICKIVAEEEINLKFEFKLAKIQDILKKVYIRNIYKARKKNISILLNVAENLPNISIDPDKIEDAIENLIDNAIKFSSQYKSVFIDIKQVENEIVIIIADQGLGFTDEDLHKLFLKGETLSAKPTDNEPSSGLGLWIVKKIIDEHKGKITVESTVGQGSKFTIVLPL